jgi:[protein-PII] uridylyltransferase
MTTVRASLYPDARLSTGNLGSLSELGMQCEQKRREIQERFDEGGSARDTMHALCELADQTILEVFGGLLRNHGVNQQGFCLLAIGGYGRRQLFPFSDLDILFLFESKRAEQESRQLIAELSRTLWDLGFRVSSAGRTLEECKRIEADNAEFHLALLDRRFLVGDGTPYEKLDKKVLPASEKQARPFLLAQLQKLTQERHGRFGNTIFHLEPNVKEAPGGLRDYQAKSWFRHIEGSAASASMADAIAIAVDFLSAIRCFLHYRNSRNDNTLTYELQASAAHRGLGLLDGLDRNPEAWMRLYFRHARTLNRQLLRNLEPKCFVRQTLRQRLFNVARGPKAEPIDGKPFEVRERQLEVLDQRSLSDRAVTFSLFGEAARTGIQLSHKAEFSIAYILTHPELPARNTEMSWGTLRGILAMEYPALALRPMQRLGVLADVLPELRAIDSLVIRDFYHRYTVDEHSLRAIEHLQELAEPKDECAAYFTDLWKSVDQRELLIFALLLHDVGKGMAVEDHITGSLEALDSAATRLQLEPHEKDEVRFLIEHHLDMSSTLLRRDIFDPQTIATFSKTVSTVERLSRLCLLSYADIRAVNPEALTPWKAEMLWQLFAAASNYLNRSVDRDRLHSVQEKAAIDEVTSKATGTDEERFLEGFPRRYLAVHAPAEIAQHFSMHKRLDTDAVQIELKTARHAYSLTLLTQDRPALFAKISGVLSSWGMSIMKADAFANASGIVLDTFHFIDLHNTLELNPGEITRLRQNLSDVLNGHAALEPLLHARMHATHSRSPKVTVPTKISFDDESSTHSTLLEILAQDRPGLLYEISSILSRFGCNIEVALIDTEGQKAIDVFYLTRNGGKVPAELQLRITNAFSGPM